MNRPTPLLRSTLPTAIALLTVTTSFSDAGRPSAIAENTVRATSPQGAENNDYASEASWAKRTEACGPHSLYILLRLLGHEPDLHQLLDSFQYTSRGVDMLQLKEVSDKQGCPCVVAQIVPGELHPDQLPMIVLLRPPVGDKGHFSVLTAVTEKTYDIIDGTTGERVSLSHDGFHRLWTGYALYPIPQSQEHLLLIGLLATSGGLVLYWLHLTRGRRRETAPGDGLAIQPVASA